MRTIFLRTVLPFLLLLAARAAAQDLQLGVIFPAFQI
jgi:hypothetical protein